MTTETGGPTLQQNVRINCFCNNEQSMTYVIVFISKNKGRGKLSDSSIAIEHWTTGQGYSLSIHLLSIKLCQPFNFLSKICFYQSHKKILHFNIQYLTFNFCLFPKKIQLCTSKYIADNHSETADSVAQEKTLNVQPKCFYFIINLRFL